MTLLLTEAEVMSAILHYARLKTTEPEKFDYHVRIHWRGESASVEIRKKVTETAK